MKVKLFKAFHADEAPALPGELQDSDRLEEYLCNLLMHAARVDAYARKPEDRRFWFSIDRHGTITAELRVPVSFDVS